MSVMMIAMLVVMAVAFFGPGHHSMMARNHSEVSAKCEGDAGPACATHTPESRSEDAEDAAAPELGQ